MSSALDPLTGTSLMPMNVSYTALVATLVLLLAVSSAIVIRSLILRRRHQRLVEEAIRTGTWLPHHFNSTTGRRRRDIGQKPKLWESWLHPSDDDGENEEDEKRSWGDIMVGLHAVWPVVINHSIPSLFMPHMSILPRHHLRGPQQTPRRIPQTLHCVLHDSYDLLQGNDHRHCHRLPLRCRWQAKNHLYPLHLRQ